MGKFTPVSSKDIVSVVFGRTNKREKFVLKHASYNLVGDISGGKHKKRDVNKRGWSKRKLSLERGF